MTDAFIERRFDLAPTGEVAVRFFRPIQEGADFRCDYEIVWPDRTRRFHSYGVDSIQALILALGMVHAELSTSPEGERDELGWRGSSDLGLK